VNTRDGKARKEPKNSTFFTIRPSHKSKIESSPMKSKFSIDRHASAPEKHGIPNRGVLPGASRATLGLASPSALAEHSTSPPQEVAPLVRQDALEDFEDFSPALNRTLSRPQRGRPKNPIHPTSIRGAGKSAKTSIPQTISDSIFLLSRIYLDIGLPAAEALLAALADCKRDFFCTDVETV
jgi:hypothetical protein